MDTENTGLEAGVPHGTATGHSPDRRYSSHLATQAGRRTGDQVREAVDRDGR